MAADSKFHYSVETLLEYEKDQPFDAEQVMDKESTLNVALHQLVGDFDRESNLSLSRFFCARSTPVISTGSLKLDLALGIGGLPKVIIILITFVLHLLFFSYIFKAYILEAL